MLEKGKGLLLGKLCIIQLIEANLQLVIIICTNVRNKYQIECNNRISKISFKSWLNYSIDTAILWKRLIYNISKLDRVLTAYNVTDLEVCYNKNLLNIRNIIQETIRIERPAIKLIAK